MRKRFLAAAGALLSGSAIAAAHPHSATPPVLPPVARIFIWTGVNFGFLIGFAFFDRQTVRITANMAFTAGTVAALRRPAALRLDDEGLSNIDGGIGFDVQLKPSQGLVIGAAADATQIDLRRRDVYVGLAALAPLPVTSVYRRSLDYLGTVRSRIGYGFDCFLIYSTGGFAFGGVEYASQTMRLARETIGAQAVR